jgi:CheY-like chemotaxis protein/anti-sigma regulatory factor (Ser/Thr protein kinase)
LLALLNDVLDISRIESGHLALSVEAVPLGPLFTDVLDLIRPLAETAGVHLTPTPPLPAGLCVTADRQRLRQVLINLMSNAVKYNHPTGTAAITVQHQPEQRLRIQVTDTGRGITGESLRKLFTPFERLDAAQTGIEGTGLGLALSRHLTEAMGGTLHVSSRPGTGSTFWIDLPITTGGTSHPDTDDTDLAPRGYPGPKRILYVEDVAENIRLVQELLTRRPSVTLLPAMLAGAALDLAREHHPDLILLDLHLPDMPGEDLLALLRTQPATRDIPVIVLSADATPHHINQLHAAGVTTYLTKPLAVRQLLQTLDTLFDPPEDAARTEPSDKTDNRPGRT